MPTACSRRHSEVGRLLGALAGSAASERTSTCSRLDALTPSGRLRSPSSPCRQRASGPMMGTDHVAEVKDPMRRPLLARLRASSSLPRSDRSRPCPPPRVGRATATRRPRTAAAAATARSGPDATPAVAGRQRSRSSTARSTMTLVGPGVGRPPGRRPARDDPFRPPTPPGRRSGGWTPPSRRRPSTFRLPAMRSGSARSSSASAMPASTSSSSGAVPSTRPRVRRSRRARPRRGRSRVARAGSPGSLGSAVSEHLADGSWRHTLDLSRGAAGFGPAAVLGARRDRLRSFDIGVERDRAEHDPARMRDILRALWMRLRGP